MLVGAYIVTVYFITFEGVSGFSSGSDANQQQQRSWMRQALTQFVRSDAQDFDDLTYVEILKALDKTPLASFLNEDTMEALYKVVTYMDEKRMAV